MKRYVHLRSYLCLAFACGLALAQAPKDDDDAYAVNRNMYKKSAEAADLNKTLNIKLAMAKLLWPVDLGVLKSPANDLKFRDQIKALQAQMGVRATGNLTYTQDTMLSNAAAMFYERRAHGGMQKIFFRNEDKNYIAAEGSLSMEGMAFPINQAKIDCFKSDKTCTVSQADFDVNGIGGQLLNVSTAMYVITEFSDTKVAAERIAFCGKATLAIDVKAKTAKIVSVPNLISERCLKVMSWMKESDRERIQIVTLVDPWDASTRFYDARKAEAEKLVYKPNLRIFEIWK